MTVIAHLSLAGLSCITEASAVFMIKAYKTMHRHLYLLLIPIIIDIGALFAGLKFTQFYEVERPSIILIYDIGLPSLSHILNKPLLMNTFKYFADFDELSLTIIAGVLAFVMINAIAQGAYIGILYHISHEKHVSMQQVLYYVNRFWLRFFMLTIIFALLQLSVVLLMTIFFKIIGVFASLALFIVMRIFFIYFEYTMVIEDCFYGQALRRSFRYFIHGIRQNAVIVPLVFITAGVLSYILHSFWSLGSVIVFIVIYAYIMTALQLALMMSLRKIKEEALLSHS